MKKLLLLLFIIWPFLAEAQDWAVADSAGTILSGISDLDTILFTFPQNQLPKKMGSDTTKAARTAMLPPDFVRVAGDFSLWLNRLNMNGAADSFRVYYKPLDPWSGRPARNESTFVIGSASTYGTFTSTSRYDVTLPVSKGVAIMILKGDLGTPIRTRVVASIVYSQ